MVLHLGTSGGQVADLQRRLAAAGYSPGAVDGAFGPATLAALRNYQASHGLAVDGVYGPATAASFATVQGTPAGAPIPPTAIQPPAAMAPEQDPAYLRFAAAQGVREDELAAYTRMRQDALQAELVARTQGTEHQLGTDIRNIGGTFGDRGSFMSSSRQLEQGRAAAQARLGENVEQTSTLNQRNDLQAQMENQAAEMRRATTEAGMQTREQMPVNSANQGLY